MLDHEHDCDTGELNWQFSFYERIHQEKGAHEKNRSVRCGNCCYCGTFERIVVLNSSCMACIAVT